MEFSRSAQNRAYKRSAEAESVESTSAPIGVDVSLVVVAVTDG